MEMKFRKLRDKDEEKCEGATLVNLVMTMSDL